MLKRRVFVFGRFIAAVAIATLPGCSGSAKKTPATGERSYSVAVNYDLSLEKMVDAGHYDYVDDAIVTGFRRVVRGEDPEKCQGRKDVKVHLVHFNRPISSAGVHRELDYRGLRPATAAELFAFGAQYPNKPVKVSNCCPVASLGTVWRGMSGDLYVASLSWSESGRRLALSHLRGDWNGEWFAYWRFLAVSEGS